MLFNTLHAKLCMYVVAPLFVCGFQKTRSKSRNRSLKSYPTIRIVRIFHRPIGNIFVLIIVRNTIIEKRRGERRSELNKKEEKGKEKK